MSLLVLSEESKSKLKSIAEQLAMARLPYKYGAEVYLDMTVEQVIKQNQPFDCSELIEYLFHKIGYIVKDGAINQYNTSCPVEEKDMICGDLIFKQKNNIINHVGIVIGGKPCMIVEAEGWYSKVIKRHYSDFITCSPRASQFAGLRRFNVDSVKSI
jgi:hypothetical protein